MSDTRTQVGLITAGIETLGYKLADDMFDFDAVPSSAINKAYRLDVRTEGVEELSGKRVDKHKAVDVWLAYRVTAKGNRETAFLDVLDSVEAAEDKLLQVITDGPSLINASSMSKYVGDHIIARVSLTFTIWRDLT